MITNIQVKLLLAVVFSFLITLGEAQKPTQKPLRVVAFYTAKSDPAHISFVHEANQWFPAAGKKFNFTHDATDDWGNLNTKFLKRYDVVIFLDTRPEDSAQRIAFQAYMENGGRWMGFHFSGFALTPSDYPQNWDWYHNTFLGSGEYKSNTWRPTSAVLKIEDAAHPVCQNLPDTFSSAPNEWYRWTADLTQNKDIQILLSIDSSSFPLGTGPKTHEIWHEGYYPVVWTNKKYKMIYFNMGHNDIDYEHGKNRDLSNSFGRDTQNQLILNALLWLAQ